MATITKVGNKFRVQFRKAGQKSFSETFNDEPSAKKWKAQQELAMDAGKKVGVHGKTGVLFGEAVDKYIAEGKNFSKTTTDILGYLKSALGKVRLDKMTDDHIVSYIVAKDFSPMSGAMHFSYFSSVLKMAKFGWKYHVPEILVEARERLKILGRIGTSEERDRRPTQEEIDVLLNYKFPTPIPMADIIRFAISSAMRQAEITRIEHGTIKLPQLKSEKATVLITDRKHPKKKKGNNQDVPLLDESIEIINRQPRKEGDDRIFPFAPTTIGTYFTAACKKLGIEDLHFHDLRHEATSRLFEMGYQIEEVTKFTGHLDWKMLRRYTHLKAKNIRSLEVKAEPAAVETAPIGVDMKELEEFRQFQKMKKMMAMMNDAVPA
jgi:integrase